MLNCVIMAGGGETRLCSENCEARLKQFMKRQGERNMLAQTFDRIVNLTPPNNIWISTCESMLNLVRESLPEIIPPRIIVEPASRNTAPCIGLAAIRVLREDPTATMLVLPADQIIEPTASFRNCVRFAVELVNENPDRLITFGIKPTFPSESYGYIERGDSAGQNAFNVPKFHEKPDVQNATKYMESGAFFWNSGIFVWKAKRILDLIKKFEPEIGTKLDAISDGVIRPDFGDVLRTEFESMKKISIDHSVLERAEQIIVIQATFDWVDIGTEESLDRSYTRVG